MIIITPESAPNKELRDRALTAGGRSYEMGISLSGLAAYEQLIMGRALLYDRLYYHHKVRASEEMLRELIRTSIRDSGEAPLLSNFFALASETEYVSVWGGTLKSELIKAGGAAATRLSEMLLSRQIYNRAACFAARFIAGLNGLPAKDQKDTRQLQWDDVIKALRTEEGSHKFSADVFEIAKNIGQSIPELKTVAATLSAQDILVDFPINKAKLARGNDILTRTEAGRVVPPNLFFDAEKWSLAYEQQKLVGHIFAAVDYVPLVALASKIALYNRFAIVMSADADNAAKTTGTVKKGWLTAAASAGLCSAECVEALTTETPNLLRLRNQDFKLIGQWESDKPALRADLEKGFLAALPSGLPAGAHQNVVDTIYDLATFVDMIEQTGQFAKKSSFLEAELQQQLKAHLISRQVPVREGTEIAAGETDLLLYERVLVENKVQAESSNPFETGPNYPYQARRYSLALVRRVSFVVVAYKPKSESAILPLPERIRVSPINNVPEEHAEVRIVIPWGYGVPSKAKHPTTDI